jgi:hypothetical protein
VRGDGGVRIAMVGRGGLLYPTNYPQNRATRPANEKVTRSDRAYDSWAPCFIVFQIQN